MFKKAVKSLGTAKNKPQDIFSVTKSCTSINLLLQSDLSSKLGETLPCVTRKVAQNTRSSYRESFGQENLKSVCIVQRSI